MGVHKKSNFVENKIISAAGNVLDDDIVFTDENKNRVFGAVVMCGYAGVGYYIPILFPVVAKDIESAKKILLTYPRVKANVAGCILSIKEISATEAEFIKLINLYDPYLTYSNSKVMIARRKILMPFYAKMLNDKISGHHLSGVEKERLEKLQCCDVDKVKFSEEYGSYYVLQKYFAPSLEKGQIVYPKRINLDNVLRDYFESRTLHLGVKSENMQVISFYLRLFGNHNPLGITLDTHSSQVQFFGDNGERKSKIVSKEFADKIVFNQEFRLRDAVEHKEANSEKTTFEGYGCKAKGVSQIEKFNRRLEKTAELNKRNK